MAARSFRQNAAGDIQADEWRVLDHARRARSSSIAESVGRPYRPATNSAGIGSREVNYAVTTRRAAESVAFRATLLHFCGEFIDASLRESEPRRARR
jgi:hypothetical protein